MPSGNARGIAAGIEQGARNFLDSYLNVKQMKEANKYRKLAPIIQATMASISNPDTPLDQQILSMNALPHILDPKYSGPPLATQLGLDKLADKQIMTEQGQAGQMVEDPNVVAVNEQKRKLKPVASPPLGSEEVYTNDTPMAESIQTKSTQDEYKRRGELSQSEVTDIQKRKLQVAQREDAFEIERRLAYLHSDLQEKAADRAGFEKGEWVFDPEAGQWTRVFSNPRTGEKAYDRLNPGLIPAPVYNELLKTEGSGTTGAYKTLKHIVAQRMGLPDDDPRVESAAGQMYEKNFTLGVQRKEQINTGTQPESPDQKFDNKVKIAQLQTEHNKIVAEKLAVEQSIPELQTRTDDAVKERNRTKKVLDDIIADDGQPGDPEYDAASAQYNRAFDNAKGLEDQLRVTKQRHATLKGQVEAGEDTINQLRGGANSSTSSGGFSPRMLAAINAVKNDPKNAEAIKGLSDKQIADWIRTKRPDIK